jgi:hypothetical protein
MPEASPPGKIRYYDEGYLPLEGKMTTQSSTATMVIITNA